jgi:TupA-like ATPgrasp
MRNALLLRLSGRNRAIKSIHDDIDLLLRTFLYHLSPLFLVEYLHIRQRGKFFHSHNPRTFEQKLLWLMLYWRHPLKSRCADKYAVRSFVEENGLAHTLPRLLGVYSKVEEIDFASLPERFALKCTHGSGFNIFCRDRKNLDIEEAKRKLKSWLKMDISKFGGEVHYASIRPRIICEVYMEEPSGCFPIDYKIHCFNGQAHCTMVCTGRETGHAKFDFYDREWKNKLPYCRSSLLADRDIPRPEAYEEMIAAAEALAKPFPFVRMDFFCLNGKAVFGEMTFTPNGCIDRDLTDTAQNIMGNLIALPPKYR